MPSPHGVKTSPPWVPIRSSSALSTRAGPVRPHIVPSFIFVPNHARPGFLLPGIDDIDVFGMHLSNSSYAKACPFLSSIRICSPAFQVRRLIPRAPRSSSSVSPPGVAVEDTWLSVVGLSPSTLPITHTSASDDISTPLCPATHYHFIREIAPLAKYEVRLTIDGWDHKWVRSFLHFWVHVAERPTACRFFHIAWTFEPVDGTFIQLYIVARYVTRPTRRRHARTSPQSISSPPTPENGSLAQNGSASVEQAVAALAQADPDQNGVAIRRPPIVEPDGAVLHCIAVSQICFKAGRITIPPAIVLASEGFTKPCADEVAIVNGVKGDANVYSRTNPPPNWTKSQSIRVPPCGSMEAFQAFLQGGWRDVPEGERWWEAALGGSIERKRQANLEVLNALKQGLERTRTLH